jgi:hypothetical protein
MRLLIGISILLTSPAFCRPVAILTHDLPWAVVGSPYEITIQTAVDGRCPLGNVAFSVVKGALPQGLEVRGPYLTGEPRKPGTYNFWIQAANMCATSAAAFQLVVTGKPVLKAFPEEIAFEYHLGQPAPHESAIALSATWPHLAYSVAGDEPWLSCLPRSGVTPDEGSPFAADIVSVAVNPENLKPGTYRSIIKFSAWHAANRPTVSVILTILP